jgi:hypothetical protein
VTIARSPADRTGDDMPRGAAHAAGSRSAHRSRSRRAARAGGHSSSGCRGSRRERSSLRAINEPAAARLRRAIRNSSPGRGNRQDAEGAALHSRDRSEKPSPEGQTAAAHAAPFAQQRPIRRVAFRPRRRGRLDLPSNATPRSLDGRTVPWRSAIRDDAAMATPPIRRSGLVQDRPEQRYVVGKPIRRFHLARVAVSPRSAVGEDRHERMEAVADARRVSRRPEVGSRKRARQDSNLRPPAPEAGALSPELRALRVSLARF